MSTVPVDGQITSLTVLPAFDGSEVFEVVSPGNANQGNSFQVALATITAWVVAQFYAGTPYRLIQSGSSVLVQPSDTGFLIDKTVGSPTDIDLPAASTRNGVPVWAKDYKGDANTNNIRFVVSGGETIDGFNQATADANGTSKIAIAYGSQTLWPLIGGGGWYIRN